MLTGTPITTNPAPPATASVTTTHPEYDAMKDRWQTMRDVREGAKAVKDKDVTYLPKLPAMDTDEYTAYKDRADWYGATKRTILGMLGMIFRKDLEWDGMSTAGEALMEDVTLNAEPLNTFAKHITDEVLTTTRFGFLVDVQQEESIDARPYFVGYTAEQITNWKSRVINGEEILTLVVVREASDIDEDPDGFGHEVVDQYRVLRLRIGSATQISPETRTYSQELWQTRTTVDQHGKETTSWVKIKDILPMRRGKPLTFIPFFLVNLTDTRPTIQDPILYDLALMNISHYRTSADLEHAAHWLACPTPWVKGVDKKTKLQIGSSTAWVLENKDAACGILEFTGQGLQALEVRYKEKKTDMVQLGASLMEEQKREAEATDTLKLRQSGDSSVLMTIVTTVSTALTAGVNCLIDWAGGVEEGSEAKVELNRDFFPIGMTPAELDSLVRSFQAGTISYETFYYNIRKGELTRPDVEAEEELDAIETQRGAPAGQPTPEEQAALEEEEQEEEPPPEDIAA